MGGDVGYTRREIDELRLDLFLTDTLNYCGGKGLLVKSKVQIFFFIHFFRFFLDFSVIFLLSDIMHFSILSLQNHKNHYQ